MRPDTWPAGSSVITVAMKSLALLTKGAIIEKTAHPVGGIDPELSRDLGISDPAGDPQDHLNCHRDEFTIVKSEGIGPSHSPIARAARAPMNSASSACSNYR